MRENIVGENREQFTIQGESGSMVVTILHREPVGLGAERKNRLTVQTVIDGEQKVITLFERYYDIKSGAAQHFIAMWKLFKEAGLPVPPLLFTSEKKPGYIFVTDMTANGEKIYGKGMNEEAQKQPKELLRKRDEVDNHFLKIMSTQLQALTEQIHEIARQATEKGLLLPQDDPFELRVMADGSWQVVILDLLDANLGSKFMNADRITLKNENSAQFFLYTLNSIKKALRMPYFMFINNWIRYGLVK